jgi:hypothetical protein
MAARDEFSKAAKEYVDKALAERSRLGYTANVSKKSYSRAVAQAADVFGKLARTSESERPQ